MSIRRSDNPDLYDRVQEQNLLRQYDLLANCMEIGLSKGIDAFDKYTLWALNYAAVANIAQFGGRFRESPIYVANHIPPHFREVSHLMDQFFPLSTRIGIAPRILYCYQRMHCGALTGHIHLSRVTGAPLGRRVIT